MAITIKSQSEFEKMRKAGKIIGTFLHEVESHIKPGVTTVELDELAETFITKKGGKPAFKGYHGFPATICASVNEQVVHGIPTRTQLKEGDIVGIDVGAIVEGFYADAARTFAVGKISNNVQKLLNTTKDALQKGIEQIKPGNRISDISHAIESYVKPHGYGIVRQYVGHGIGSQLHEDPQVPNFGKPNRGELIREGMALAIEPMLNEGSESVEVSNDGWTVVTKDKSKSAHFENTVLVTNKGIEISTQYG